MILGPSQFFRGTMWRFLILLIAVSLVPWVGSSQTEPNKSSQAAAQTASAPVIANFVDIAEKAGLKMTNVFGDGVSKKYIIETTGTGAAIFDYDNDGWPDIYLVNGTTL